ncbi:MAG: hypothetical protein U0166_13720 [Acidobacteriota bacterium]
MHSVVLRTSDRDARLHVPFGPEGYEPDPLPGPIARLLGARGLEIAHPHALSYGRVVEYLLSHLDRIFEKRQIVQRMRKVSCAEVLKLCEIVVVPTYPGDEELFDSAFFRYLLLPPASRTAGSRRSSTARRTVRAGPARSGPVQRHQDRRDTGEACGDAADASQGSGSDRAAGDDHRGRAGVREESSPA